MKQSFVEMQDAFHFAAVVAVKAPAMHCVVVHSASKMHEAFATVVVGMTPACLAAIVAPWPSVSYFLQLVV